MPGSPGPRINLRPGPFFKAAAGRLDLRSRKGFPVTVAATIAVLAFLGFLSIVEDVLEPVMGLMDRAAQASVLLVRTPLLTKFFWIATLMGDWRVMIVETLVAALLLAVWGHPRRAGSVAILVLTGQLVSTLLKGFVDRPRPSASLALIAEPTSASFPSGHALAGVLLFGTLALMLAASKQRPWLRISGTVGIAAVSIAIGVSRVYLGVHYASDVLASWLLGMTMLATWAAAVLVWGRTQPPEERRTFEAWGHAWWRWALVVLGAVAAVVSIVAEMGSLPLL